jgi:pimeloyl-ACP methyl ester carboxylesterase
MEVTNHNVDINGINISYLEKGKGKLLLFLHGFPDNALTFSKQMDFFAEKGYRVIVPFMRGYFPSTIPTDEKYYSSTIGKDVIELIKSLGDQKAILIGHDWGATAAYTAAAIQPEVIEKLIAVSVSRGTFSKALITNPEQQRKSWYIYFFQLPFAETAITYNNFAFIRRLWKDWSAKDWETPSDHIESVIKTLKNDGVLKAAISYYRCFFDMSKLSKEEVEQQRNSSMEKITVPTLYLHGSEDGCIGPELCDGMEEFFIGGFDKKIIEGAGHFIHLEKPNEFNTMILKFIDNC